ncbi:MAG: RluA family pseudouridine synthase [Bacillus subtilis]|nr:RluA family pseudouridine synthase [Bacillus subtilis]
MVLYNDIASKRQTLQEYLDDFHLGRKNLYLLQTHHLVQINGFVRPFSAQLEKGDRVDIDLSMFEEPLFQATFEPLAILFEDADLLIVDKPAGQIVYPDDPLKTGTLVNAVQGYYEQTNQIRSVRYLHRLDSDTTGCLVIAKHLLAHAKLSQLWNHVDIQRTYLAVVDGIVPSTRGVLKQPIGKDRHQNNVYRVSPSGQAAITEYAVIDRGARHTLVEFTLRTGRTHQIRVHSAHWGHPVCGDAVYGSKTKGELCLHANRIVLPHPRTHQTIIIEAPVPHRFASFFEEKRGII